MSRLRSFLLLVAFLGVAFVSICAGEEARRDIVATEKKLYSQHDEELVIRDFFQDRKDGLFLDVGCAWPVKMSTTYYLEKHLGWSGIAIDALEEYGPAWKAERPRSKFFTFLVSDHSDTVDAFYRAAGTGLSSTEKDRVFRGKRVDQKEAG